MSGSEREPEYTIINNEEFKIGLGLDEEGYPSVLDLQGMCSGCGNLVVEGYSEQDSREVARYIIDDVIRNSNKEDVTIAVSGIDVVEFNGLPRNVRMCKGIDSKERYTELLDTLKEEINNRIDFLVSRKYTSYYDYLRSQGSNAEYGRMVIVLDDLEEAMTHFDTEMHRSLKKVLRSANVVGIAVVVSLQVDSNKTLPDFYSAFLNNNVLSIRSSEKSGRGEFIADLYVSDSLAYSGIKIQK